jgi:hypothetical protein
MLCYHHIVIIQKLQWLIPGIDEISFDIDKKNEFLDHSWKRVS